MLDIIPCCLILVIITCLLYVCFRKQRVPDVTRKAVFISGCDSGIGHRLAVLFCDLGCDVFAGCLKPEAAIASLPPAVRVIPLDVTDEDSVKAAVKRTADELRKLEKDLWAVINNAGICVYGQVQVNLLGTIRVTKAFLPLIRRSKGRVVTITSVNGSVAYPGLAVYCATKFGLEGFSDALRQEVSKYGVRVIVVQPGDFARLTNIMAAHDEKAKEMWGAMSEEDRQFYGSYFHNYHEMVMKNYGITSPKNFESSPLLADVEDAVFATSPAARYKSAPPSFKVFFFLLSVLPVSMSDAVLGILFKKVFAAK